LLNITGSSDLGLLEVNAAAELVQKFADPEANIIFGAVIDENLQDEVIITVIATGFEKSAQNTFERIKEKQIPQSQDKRSTDVPHVDELEIPTFLRKNNRFK